MSYHSAQFDSCNMVVPSSRVWRAWFERMAYIVPKGTTTFALIINYTKWERQIFQYKCMGNDRERLRKSELQTKQEI